MNMIEQPEVQMEYFRGRGVVGIHWQGAKVLRSYVIEYWRDRIDSQWETNSCSSCRVVLKPLIL